MTQHWAEKLADSLLFNGFIKECDKEIYSYHIQILLEKNNWFFSHFSDFILDKKSRTDYFVCILFFLYSKACRRFSRE